MERTANIIKTVRKSKSLQLLLILGLPMGFLAVFFFSPFVFVLMYSFGMINEARVITLTPSLQYFIKALSMEGVRTLIFRTLRYAVIATFSCLVLGYPAAYNIAFKVKKNKEILLFLFILPFWISGLLRTYALIPILADNGFINNALISMGLIREPIRILYTETSVLIGMVSNGLAMAVLPLYGSIEKLDKSLLESSYILGASPLKTFIRVTLPLTMPGILAATVLVFVPATGGFIVPMLLGTTDTYMIGNLIWDIFLYVRDWYFGSAFSLIFIIFVLAIVLVYIRYAGREELTLG